MVSITDENLRDEMIGYGNAALCLFMVQYNNIYYIYIPIAIDDRDTRDYSIHVFVQFNIYNVSLASYCCNQVK